MMRVSHLLVLAALAGATAQLTACSLLQPDPPPERDAALRLEHGLRALDGGQYRTAFDELSWVYVHCPGRTASTRALAGLAALELDPRNRHSRPEVGTELLGRLIGGATTPDWVRPLVESGYLMALALGAPPAPAPTSPPSAVSSATGQTEPFGEEGPRDGAAAAPPPTTPLEERSGEPVHGCGAPVRASAGAVAGTMPVLPGPSMVALLLELESERDALAGRTDTLAKELAATSRELEETKAELERIRKVLKP